MVEFRCITSLSDNWREIAMESLECTPVERVTLLEALATELAVVGVNRSNMSTPTAADADDQ